jgi:type IV pilus assembly protein PilM
MRLLPSRIPSLDVKLPGSFGRRSGEDLVGLDIQPGFIAAVRARVNGSIAAEQAVTLSLPGDAVRDGEVGDAQALSEALRELFANSGLGKRVRVGVANQRSVLRTLEVPPVTDHKELVAAVNFQAQDQVPMPLGNAVMDFHPLGIVDTPAGPRQRVVLVAAQRDMIERLLSAVRQAGLSPEAVDLSAFALIRSLYRREDEQTGRVLYLNVDGLSNLAIAEGKVCRFTRVVGSGMEGMATELAERRSIAIAEAREILAGVDLTAPPSSEPGDGASHEHEDADADADAPSADELDAAVGDEQAPEAPAQAASHEEAEEHERAMSYEELTAVEASDSPPAERVSSSDPDVLAVLENGIRDISGEVRNSLDFHRSQEGGGEVSHVVLSGSVQDIPGFADALQSSLGVEVRCHELAVVDERLTGTVAAHRLAVATGLAAAEAPQ